MSLRIRTNTTAMHAYGDMQRVGRNLSQTFKRISSGLRINQAADDAAGLGVAENLQKKKMSLKQARRNTHDGISVVQTAEGATTEVSDILKRMRELATQSSTETLNDDERSYIQDEFTQLSEEIDRISETTEFNGISLTDGTGGIDGDNTMEVQVGINNSGNDRVSIALGDLRSKSLGVSSKGGAGSISMSTAAGARNAISKVTKALKVVNTYRSRYGSVQRRLESAMNTLDTTHENTAAAESRIRDADFAQETAQMSKYQVMQ